MSITSPHGCKLSCRGWHQEAAMRMLMNNLDPQVAEHPQELIVYGGAGKAARNWQCYHKIIETLKRLGNEETLLVQSGKPVGVFPTHEEAPRVLIANAHLVPKWATQEEFDRLDQLGLTMYGQMTAGSWIYIGTQGILQGTYQTFARCAAKHFQGSLKGRLIVTAGLGGMGGAQPLAATMNGAVLLAVEVDPQRIERRLQTGYLDTMATSLDEALGLVLQAKEQKKALSVGLLGNIAQVLPEMAQRGVEVDILTDQTAAHDLHLGYIPVGLSVQEAAQLRKTDASAYKKRVLDSMCLHVKAMLEFQKRGTIVFDYGNNLRAQVAEHRGMQEAFHIPGFICEYIRPLFCKGAGPFRWAALSGNPQDIFTTDQAIIDLFSDQEELCHWICQAQQKVKFQGLPARICWLECGQRCQAGELFNWLVKRKKVQAPLVIGRDHLDCGSVASPYRETEKMLDGSDAIADWPLLNALLNTACGASWVAIHHGGGVGIGNSIHAGMVCVADGTRGAKRRLHRVLSADPATGVMRHADAGYALAIQTARKKSLDLPMVK